MADSETWKRLVHRLTLAGRRLIQFRVPGTGVPRFAGERLDQSRRAGRARDAESDALDWVDHARDEDGWT